MRRLAAPLVVYGAPVRVRWLAVLAVYFFGDFVNIALIDQFASAVFTANIDHAVTVSL